jgi:hypothetical protein
MRTAIFAAFLLLLGAVVLGATVFREPIARAAGLAPSAPVTAVNTPAQAIPVAEQNVDPNTGSINVHEHGIANVNVNGLVTTQSALPAKSFSKRLVLPAEREIDGCGAGLPAGTQWFVTSFATTNFASFSNAAALHVVTAGGAEEEVGPQISMPSFQTAQLTFPQPYVLTSAATGDCLAVRDSGLGGPDDNIVAMVVGYRK